MAGIASIIVFSLFFVGIILVMRLVGAWMLRINDVIQELQEIKYILKNNQGVVKPTGTAIPSVPIAEPPTGSKNDYV